MATAEIIIPYESHFNILVHPSELKNRQEDYQGIDKPSFISFVDDISSPTSIGFQHDPIPTPCLSPIVGNLHDGGILPALDLSLPSTSTLCSRVFEQLSLVVPIERHSPELSVEDLLKREVIEHERESAFYVVDLGIVVKKYVQWVQAMPRVKPFYAIKCNPNNAIVRTLHALGCGFDCASKKEMEQVLALGVSPEDIIFANPCKIKAHLEFAKKAGVTMMTFDNADELVKIRHFHPGARLVLRLLPPDSGSAVCCFGSKFGANVAQAKRLIELVRELELEVIGCSFHVGSGCFSTNAYIGAIMLAREVFDYAAKLGYDMTLLDIGGGWPGIDNVQLPFPCIASVVAPLVDRLFPPHVKVIAEPGRYFSSECASLAVNVIAKRCTPPGPPSTGLEQPAILYYISDGIYGSFNNLFFDHAVVVHRPLVVKDPEAPRKRATFFGPTCDSIDKVLENVEVGEMEVGDWMWFEEMGAYTMASSSSFNGFEPPPAVFVMRF